MEKNGYFQIISDPSGQVLFEKRPTRNVTFHRLCLNNRPKLHCPYLHLHNDAVVVLNWIDDVQGRWMARNVKHEYVELFPEDIGDEGADDNAGADDTTNDEDDVDDMINKVHLDAFNPKRDGVEFISPICNYTCQTDRLPHETPLYPGQVLCNQMHRFGMTDQGEFFVQNCQLTDQNDGKLNFGPQQLFEKRPTRNVTFHRLCLNNRPKLHCPYLHLRETGMAVLNWIDDVQGKWMARDMKQQYLGLFPNVDNKDRFL